MARPKKPQVGSEKWAANELALAEKRLREVRRLIESADDSALPGLLRLEAALRREVQRLARLAAPCAVMDWCYDTAGLERAMREEMANLGREAAPPLSTEK